MILLKENLEHRLERVVCDLCGASSEEFLYDKPGHLTGHPFRLVRCRACGLIYLNPRLNEAALTDLYDQAYYEGKGFDPAVHYCGDAHEEPADYIKPGNLIRALQSLRPAPARLLDFGCGNGRLIEEARRAGYSADGFEVSPFAARHAAKNGAVIFNDIARIPENSYDVVTAIEVLEHCYSPMAALKTIYKALRPGGLFFYTTENFDKFYDRWSRGVTPPQDSYVTPEGHIYFFSTSVIKQYFRRVGFSQTIPFEPSVYVKSSWAYRLLSKLHLIRRDRDFPAAGWEAGLYQATRRALRLVGTRGLLPLAIK